MRRFSPSSPLAYRPPRAPAGVIAVALAGWAIAGCGAAMTTAPATQPAPPAAATVSAAAAPGRDHIVAIYQSHCGACHRPVAPGSEPPDRLQAALARHHKRARLTDQEWAGLGRFMAGR